MLLAPLALLVASLMVAPTSGVVETVPAVRVVRFQVDYPDADVSLVNKHAKWTTMLRNSVLASLRFINKHWLVCGGTELDKRTNDCGKLQVTGEVVENNHYRVNMTFISERDPIRNSKVDATSTVFGVVQIGLKGGIFQYTNALRALGKPAQTLGFDEAFFCYRGSTLFQQDKCRKTDVRSV
uniref:Lipocalin n=1 Tax=Steinernema glaseri TaxID=37863 RepID=A0A1I7Y4P8_9BILA